MNADGAAADRTAGIRDPHRFQHPDSLAAYKTLYHQSQNLMLDEGLRYEAAARLRIARR